MGAAANGFAIVADVVSLGMDVADDGNTYMSKLMTSLANRLEKSNETFAELCPEIIQKVDEVVERLKSVIALVIVSTTINKISLFRARVTITAVLISCLVKISQPN